MNAAREPVWLSIARDLVGLREIKGAQHEPEIIRLWKDAGVAITNDDDAWCAGLAGGCLARAGIKPTGSPAARSYLHWGVSVKEDRLEDIPPGAILVFERPPSTWQGHVGFADCWTDDGHLGVVGGNQKDSVSIAYLPVWRLLDARWPVEARNDLRILAKLPLKKRAGAASTNEA